MKNHQHVGKTDEFHLHTTVTPRPSGPVVVLAPGTFDYHTDFRYLEEPFKDAGIGLSIIEFVPAVEAESVHPVVYRANVCREALLTVYANNYRPIPAGTCSGSSMMGALFGIRPRDGFPHELPSPLRARDRLPLLMLGPQPPQMAELDESSWDDFVVGSLLSVIADKDFAWLGAELSDLAMADQKVQCQRKELIVLQDAGHAAFNDAEPPRYPALPRDPEHHGIIADAIISWLELLGYIEPHEKGEA